MSAILEPPAPAAKAGKVTLTPEQAAAQAERLLTGPQLARILGVSLRTVEQWSSTGVIPKIRIGTRFTRYRLHKVRAAIDRHETAVLKK